ncbi:DUF4179 domain-containing protein [Paenibacillus sp. PR3]|uniref:DUF4179 domain-containing protein n=1 Tax=Paenibacillus terricola TaxID=2763503 RepID=A0ABR8MP93_9BACL|nr:DUF4179 domain-containing protein [Paenibacillus terricola]MBD3917425.1 DUF4179 domain-containing protein [Paenibacillus terricola]
MTNTNGDASIPKINLSRVTNLTMRKIQQEKKRKTYKFNNKFARIACAIAAACILTTGGAAYAMKTDGIQVIISKLSGIPQSYVLTVGEAISNKDYKLTVHELVTDSHVGYVVLSIEALREASKEHFDSYRFALDHIGSGFSVGELDQYREPYTRFYRINFTGASNPYSRNDGKLRFSTDGMKTPIEVPLSPTVSCIDKNIAEDRSSAYQYQFNKLHLSEIGLSLEGVDTRNAEHDDQYRIELLFNDGTKALLQKQSNDSVEHGELSSGASEYHSGDDGEYVNISTAFSKALPLNTIKQVIINDIALDIE